MELSCDHLCVVPADLIIRMLVYAYSGLLKKQFSDSHAKVGDRQSSQKSYRACSIERMICEYILNICWCGFCIILGFFIFIKKKKEKRKSYFRSDALMSEE